MNETIQEFRFRDYDVSYQKVMLIRSAFDRRATTYKEQVLLYELASGFHDSAERGVILEIGTDYGSSTAVMAHAAKENGRDVPVFTLDRYEYYTLELIPNLEVSHRLNNRLRHVRRAFHELDLQDEICQIICHDSVYLPYWRLPIRLAFVDGEHSYDAVKREIQMLSDYVVAGGWILFHDYFRYEGNEAVGAHDCKDRHEELVPAVDEFIEAQSVDAIRTFRVDSTLAVQKIGVD